MTVQAIQGDVPTVGDTIWVTRTVELPPGRSLRAAEWEVADPVELLGPPRIALRGGSADVSYPLAIWRSGVLPKWAGLILVAATLIFYVFGAFLGMATTGASLPTQPIGALLITVSSGWIAWTVLRHRPAQGLPERAAPAPQHEQ